MTKDPVRQFYDRWNKPYDIFATNPIVNRWRKESINAMHIESDDVILDIGCGTGANVPTLSKKVDDTGRIICVDLSEGCLSKIKEKFYDQMRTNIDLVKADGTNLPISDVDGLYASFSIGMFSEPLNAIKEWVKQFRTGTNICLINVVESQKNMNSFVNKPLKWFTGMSVPTDFEEKVRLSYTGDALEELNSKIRQVYNYLKNNHQVVSTGEYLNGSVKWISINTT
jgi:phosphatidylethanolamine/phosphatidyl-N-methylethanolamine N-methyltransferase